MLYNIYINQLAYSEIAPSVSIEAACILNMMQQKVTLKVFQSQTKIENGNLYFWFSHSLIKDEMPMIFKGKESDAAISMKVRRLVNELEENGLIEKHPNPRAIKKSMYCFTDKTDLLTIKKEDNKTSDSYKNVQVTRTKTYKLNKVDSYKNVQGELNQSLELNQQNNSSSSFVEADANLKTQNAKSNPDEVIDNVPPIESEFKEAKKEVKVVSKKRGQAKIVKGEKSAEKENPKTSMMLHAVDFNKIEFSKIAEILFSFNDSKFRQSQIRLANVTNENFKDAVEAFLIQTTAAEPIKHITVKDLANHFANWCNTVQKDKIEQKIKALKKTTDVTAAKLSAQDEFKAIQADLIQRIQKGELSERKALEIAANKKKELGIQ